MEGALLSQPLPGGAAALHTDNPGTVARCISHGRCARGALWSRPPPVRGDVRCTSLPPSPRDASGA
eukprot:15464321-Alexandrium_andersonii.AAC.1